jgi:DNA polymerase-1
VLASASQDTRLIEAYQRGWDLHAVTTLRFFHDLPDGCDDAAYQACLKIAAQDAVQWKVERSIGKRCNFLTGYGGSGLRLQALLAEQGIYLSEEECDRYVELFFEVYPGVRTYMDGVVMAAKANGGNCLAGDGRVRHLPALLAGSPGDMAEASRQAGNHTIQWPAAKLTMLALIRLEARLQQEQLRTLVVGSIHDSIILDSPAGEQDRARDLLKEEMEAAALDPRWMPRGWLDPRIQILADVE